MSAAKHTPGPWHLGGTFEPGTPDEHCTVWSAAPPGLLSGDMVAQYVSLRDAPIIAAAPQMAEALRDLLRVCEDWEFFGGERVVRDAARAALAAAGVAP